MPRRKRIGAKKSKKSLILIVFLLVFSIIFTVTYYKMQPVIMRYAVSVAETVMLNSANKAIINILESENISYDDIVRLSNNDDGYVTSLEIDIFKVNSLKSRVANELSRIVDSAEYYDVKIPVGTFLGNTYTAGLGPKITFNMQLTSTAFVDFKHEFKAAGINQVLHIILIEMDIRGSLIIAGFNKEIKASTSAIAAQTVIVGKSPDAFTNVIESATDNTGGLINDYGALLEY